MWTLSTITMLLIKTSFHAVTIHNQASSYHGCVCSGCYVQPVVLFRLHASAPSEVHRCPIITLPAAVVASTADLTISSFVFSHHLCLLGYLDATSGCFTGDNHHHCLIACIGGHVDDANLCSYPKNRSPLM